MKIWIFHLTPNRIKFGNNQSGFFQMKILELKNQFFRLSGKKVPTFIRLRRTTVPVSLKD